MTLKEKEYREEETYDEAQIFFFLQGFEAVSQNCEEKECDDSMRAKPSNKKTYRNRKVYRND